MANVSARDSRGNPGTATFTATFTVTVRDTAAPTIHPPAGGFTPLVFAIAQGGKVALPDYLAQATISDASAVTDSAQSPSAGTLLGEGSTHVTLTAQDAEGHTSKLGLDVTVVVAGSATLAATGGAVPGAGIDPRIPAGSTWENFGVPSIASQGRLMGWEAGVRTPAVAPSLALPRGRRAGSFTGIFASVLNPPALQVRTGDPVRDANGGAVAGATFKSFREPGFGGERYAMIASVQGATAANDTGIWFGQTSGALQEIAREGAVAPGTGVKFKAFNSLAMPAAGTVFFTATLAAPGSRDLSLWIWTPATGLKLALREGDAVVAAGGTILKSFVALSSVNGSFGHGRYAAGAPALDVRLSFADRGRTTAIGTVAADGSVQLTRRSNQADPNLLVPVSFGLPSSPGQGLGATAVTIFAPDPAGGITKTSTVTIYDYHQGLIRAQRGRVAPGAEPAMFNNFSDPVTGNGGVQFFAATLTRAAASRDSGLWAYTNSLALVAREGAEPPGAVGTKWKSFTSLTVLEGRGPMFTAKLESGTAKVTAASDEGLWATDSTGTLRLIFREGDNLAGGTLKSFTVLGAVTGSPGQRRAWTDGDPSARVVYLAFFADGSSAILSTAVP